MSVITYWWGLEITMPPPTIKYLANAKSISHAVVNFLTALSVMYNGVREILPFIRYISQFIDFEWSAIKAQDKGKGVVCAATWLMPAAMVPRPWATERGSRGIICSTILYKKKAPNLQIDSRMDNDRHKIDVDQQAAVFA